VFPVQENDPSCTELGCNIASVCQIMLNSSRTSLESLVFLNQVRHVLWAAHCCHGAAQLWLCMH
jgi:hypothetical protein